MCCARPSRIFPKRTRQRAIDRAVAWVGERLNGEDGLGAIFPAMANSVMMYDALGYPEDHPQRAIARKSIEKLLVVHEHETYCQPCVSPIWDTGLACHALLEVGGERAQRAGQARPRLAHADAGARRARRLDRAAARSAAGRLGVPICQSALSRRRRHRRRRHGDGPHASAWSTPTIATAIERAREWIVGMQSGNGGWGAFDADNEYYYLNNIPFADHGALLDPPTEDVSARCLSMLAQLGDSAKPARSSAPSIICAAPNSPTARWYGRWGMNYIYGTWSVLCALNAAGFARDAPEMRKAVDWLAAIQNEDGGWGEDGSSYKLDYRGYEQAPSTASQTAWALLGFMAAGEVDHPAVARGIKYLADTQGADGFWNEPRYTATGFPARVLSALPRLCEILPAVGAGALPQSQERQCARGGVGDVGSPSARGSRETGFHLYDLRNAIRAIRSAAARCAGFAMKSGSSCRRPARSGRRCRNCE